MTDYMNKQVMDMLGVADTTLQDYHYRSAIAAVDPGAVNVSGLAHSLCDWIGLIEADLNEWDRDVEGVLFDIRWACQHAWDMGGTGTRDVNRNKHVVEHVDRLAKFAFDTDEMRRVACHPIIRLVVSQMAQLSGIVISDPYYLDRWGDAYDTAKERASD